jgi:hypothetical protein
VKISWNVPPSGSRKKNRNYDTYSDAIQLLAGIKVFKKKLSLSTVGDADTLKPATAHTTSILLSSHTH